MIGAIMEEIKNHFARSIESNYFSIESDGITGSFQEKYVTGMYIWIKNSFVNDGVYQIESVTSSKITTVEKDLLPENTGEIIIIFGLTPSKTFIQLVSKISNYKSKDGIASESIDDYSVGFSKGDGSWKTAFASELNAYRRMFDDDQRMRC